MKSHPLKIERERRGWSQSKVAEAVGTNVRTVIRWEQGQSVPYPYYREQLSNLFEKDVTELGLLVEKDETDETDEHAVSIPEASAISQGQLLDPTIPPAPGGEHGLVGRESVLRHLKERLLVGGRVALSALNGLPGVGKTALATALAYDEAVRAHFSDGILWAGLGYQPDVLGGLSRWGTLLKAMPADLSQRSRPEAWAASIRAAIGQRRMLLIIDDAWNIADTLAFQVGGPNCAHLVTTRIPELARRFTMNETVVVRELEETDGRLLLMRLAPEIVQTEPEMVQALVAEVGGLPLALTLLGNYLRAQSHSGQPRRLRAALKRLRRADERLQLSEPQALIGHHPSLAAGTPLSLQAMIGLSDQQMSEEARATLRTLALFPPKPGSFSEEAAVVISATSEDVLDELTDTGLLESSGPERYTLHQTIADYARTHFTDETAVERFTSYFVTYVEMHTTDYAALDRESSNILAMLDSAFEHGSYAAFVRGVHAFVPWMETRGLYPVAETLLQKALEAGESLGDSCNQAISWLHRGKIAQQRGDYAQAQRYWQRGLVSARQCGLGSCEAQLLRELGGLASMQGQPEQARQFLNEALNFLRQTGDERGVAETLKNLGNVYCDQGQPKQAHQVYSEALATFRRLGEIRSMGVVLQNMGILAREQGQPEQSRQLYEEALALFRKVDDRRCIAAVLNNLSNLTRQYRQYEQSRLCLEEALLIYRGLESQREYAYTLLNLGSLAIDQGQFEPAQHWLDEALTIFQNLQDRRSFALTRQTQGNMARDQHQFEKSQWYLDEAFAIFQDLGDQRQCALTRQVQGVLARERGHLEQARQCLEEALATLIELEDQREVAVTRREMDILAKQQEYV